AHSLRRALGEASRAGRGTGITLGRLSPDDVNELVRASGADASELGPMFFEESAGVPFFLTEYLAAVRADPSDEGIPAGVRDLLASRVGAVGGEPGQVLVAAAVIGRPFDADVVRTASGRGAEGVAAALDELVARGLLSVAGEAYDFTHPKLREYVYDSATPARRRLLHGRAADAFARASRRPPELAALAAQH